MTLYLFNYNNYYNRIMKREEQAEAYGDPITYIENVNFIGNNGISTEQIINYDGEQGNYVVVTEGLNDTIISRWFVLETIKVRAGQYNLKLYRDVIADWWNDIVTAPAFIEKAILDTGNDLIFNNENMTYNQVKTKETLLRDNSGTAWWAAYISSDVGQIDLNVPETEITPDIEVSSIEQYDYYQYQTEDYDGDYTGPVLYTVDVRKASFGRQATLRFSIDARNNSPTTPLGLGTVYPYLDNNSLPTGVGSLGKTNNLGNDYELVYQSPGNDITNATLVINGWQELIASQNKNGALVNSAYTYIGNKKGNDILNEQDKIIYDIDAGKYYKVSVYAVGSRRYERRIPAGSGLDDQLRNAVSNSTLPLINPAGSPFLIDATFKAYRIQLTEILVDQVQLTIPATRRHCEDAPYDILMFPYYTEDIYKTLVGTTTTNPLTIRRLIKQLMLKLASSGPQGASELYDVQLLPYVPIPENKMSQYVINKAGSVTVDDYEANKDYVLQDNCFVFFPTSCNFTKILNNVGEPHPQLKITIEVPDDPIDFKVANECDKYRLCSPNFNGAFEFSATKNRGVVGYSVTCSYKPYSPYIKVAPLFQGLYGSDFNDARGLVCGGDFSVSQISDAFTNYELNNKNYQVMFDRQIQNMEVNNAVQREREIWQAITGTLSGGASAGIAAGMVKPIAGTVAGGVGAIASGIAGARDVTLNEQLRIEAIDFAKDQFGYQLGNIKALPYNLTKVTAMNADNKLFPFVEMYTCTEREKEALRSKIKYNGMTVCAIDQMVNYIKDEPTYIKCQLIRLEIGDNFEIAKTISNELNKGVFV